MELSDIDINEIRDEIEATMQGIIDEISPYSDSEAVPRKYQKKIIRDSYNYTKETNDVPVEEFKVQPGAYVSTYVRKHQKDILNDIEKLRRG